MIHNTINLFDMLFDAALPQASTTLELSSKFPDWTYAMRDNWDGCGAKAVSSNVSEGATKLIKKFGAHLVPGDVSPGCDGSISFVWERDGNYVYLDVGPGKTVHLYYDIAGAKWEGVSLV